MVAHVLLNIFCSLFWSIWSVNAGQSTGLGGEEADAVSSPVMVSSTREHTHTPKKCPNSRKRRQQPTPVGNASPTLAMVPVPCRKAGLLLEGGHPRIPGQTPALSPPASPAALVHRQSTSRHPAPCAISSPPVWHPPGWSLQLCHIFIILNADEEVEGLFCTNILAEITSEPCLFSRWQLSIAPHFHHQTPKMLNV